MWTSSYNIYGLHGRRIPVLDDQVQSERGDSGERNSVLTSDGMRQVVGHRLKFDRDDAEQGIYFVSKDGAETKVDVVGRNKPPDLMFMPTPWKCGAPSTAARRCAPVFFRVDKTTVGSESVHVKHDYYALWDRVLHGL